MTLEEISLLRTVLAKVESVLLERNLKSYKLRKVRTCISDKSDYSDEKMIIEILAL